MFVRVSDVMSSVLKFVPFGCVSKGGYLDVHCNVLWEYKRKNNNRERKKIGQRDGIVFLMPAPEVCLVDPNNIKEKVMPACGFAYAGNKCGSVSHYPPSFQSAIPFNLGDSSPGEALRPACDVWCSRKKKSVRVVCMCLWL